MRPSIEFSNIQRILCVGAHVDDIEIGCGGSLLRMLAEHSGIAVRWVVATSNPERRDEAAHSAREFLRDARSQHLDCWDFADGYLPYVGAQVKDAFFDLRRDFNPDLVFTHRLEDRHQDHRLLAELTWNTFRDQLILEYEIPKYEGDLGHPNLFIGLSEAICQRKAELLNRCFASQRDKPWFDQDTFWALMRLRGLESKSVSRFAEAFTARKLFL